MVFISTYGSDVLTLTEPELKIIDICKLLIFAIDPDEAAHHESPHLDLHCLPCILLSLCML